MTRMMMIVLMLVTAQAFAELPEPVKLNVDHFKGLYEVGDIYFAGQPAKEGLAWARDQGVSLVVNLRTDKEMKDEYDEAGEAARLGLGYVNLPMGDDEHPYSPAAVEALADVMGKAEGKVLVHCKTAGRTSHLWAAYLVRYKGMSVPDAVAYTRKINFGTLPLEGFLGRDIVIDVVEEN